MGNLGGATGGATGTPAGTLRVLDVEAMLRTAPPPVPWVVEPLLAQGCVTMLAGREGTGKSMLALAMAAAIGHGADVAGLGCRPGRVLYVDAENGEREAHRRIHGLGGVAPGSLGYVEASGFSLASHLAELNALVEDRCPDVLMLDSLRSLAPGLDENDSQQAEAALRPVVRLTQAREMATLILHHAGKVGTEYRGSTAIGAAVELGFTLSQHPDDPDGARRRRLACWKSRPAAEPPVRG
jgi:putative DNA primase/helicase